MMPVIEFSDIEADYISHMGSDLTVVNSARVSFRKEAKEVGPSDEKLIKYLATHNHFTPFTHPQITLRYKVPIFVARQEFKHIVGFTRNEVSRRYVDDDPCFYRTDSNWRARPDKSIKQGSGGDHPDADIVEGWYIDACLQSLSLYKNLIASDVAPEQARMVLPQSMMTEYYVTGSLSAFARMYGLRNSPHAQAEIKDLAMIVGDIIAPLYPVSWEALT